MLEDKDEQKYPFLLVFLQVRGLIGTQKYISLADVRSAIYSKARSQCIFCLNCTSAITVIINRRVESFLKARSAEALLQKFEQLTLTSTKVHFQDQSAFIPC